MTATKQDQKMRVEEQYRTEREHILSHFASHDRRQLIDWCGETVWQAINNSEALYDFAGGMVLEDFVGGADDVEGDIKSAVGSQLENENTEALQERIVYYLLPQQLKQRMHKLGMVGSWSDGPQVIG